MSLKVGFPRGPLAKILIDSLRTVRGAALGLDRFLVILLAIASSPQISNARGQTLPDFFDLAGGQMLRQRLKHGTEDFS